MNIGIHDSDNTNFPNLALMKLSAHHKAKGDHVEFYDPANVFFKDGYDKIYSSKVFSFTKEFHLGKHVEKGGSGYHLFNVLPDEIEHTCPDYDLYDYDFSVGFLTRGCLRKCPWCIVPKKEGAIRKHTDIEEFTRHRNVVLLDNNVLAHPWGIEQIEKMATMDIRVDFNQGLDARLIDDGIARRLAKLKWYKPLRMACDSSKDMPHIQKATTLLRWHNTRPNCYFIYVLLKDDIEDCLERVKFLKGMYLKPFVQPFRDPFEPDKKPSKEQRKFTTWANGRQFFYAFAWEDYDDEIMKNRTKN